jgi:aminoglycoside 2''-phosphotransferase
VVNDVLIVNQQWVIRFTKSDYGKELIMLEDHLMHYLNPRVSLNVPFPVKRGDNVLVYELLGGRDFPRKLWKEAEPELKDRIAEQLGTFLRELHHAPEVMNDWEIPLTLAPVSLETWLDIQSRVVEKVYPLLLYYQVDWMDELFASAFDVEGFFDFDEVLIHGDLGPYHLLYDEAARRLNGVIDFGLAGLGDPATDLGSLIVHYGEGLVSRIKPFYPLYDKLLPRARFYAKAAEVHSALLGVETGENYWFTAHLGEARDIGE